MSMIEKRKIYISSWIREEFDEDDNPIQIYDEPYSIECTLNSMNGSYDIAVYGERVKKMCKTILDYEMISKIKEKDAVYLYGANPNKEKVHGEHANYFVVAVLPQNKKIQVHFEKNI